jgi:hypothetical protein
MPHRSVIAATAALLLGLWLGGPPIAAQEILTNESVVTMVRAGLPEAVVITKIRCTPTRFDLTTEGLVALKQAGVPDPVLEVMVGAPPRPGAVPAPIRPCPSPPPATAAGPPAGLAGMPGLMLYHAQGEQLRELQPMTGTIESTFTPFFVKQELVIPSRRSSYRTTDRQPVFRAANYPPEALLVRLRPGGRDDRNLKVVNLPPFGGTMAYGPDAEAVVPTVAERDVDGWLRVRPAAALAPGEYGFVLGMRIWDFAVD